MPLLALDRDCPNLTAPIPLENLVERPSAKAAVRVVENDVTFHHLETTSGIRIDDREARTHVAVSWRRDCASFQEIRSILA